MAITGHKTLADVERYTRAAEQERLARRAIKRQAENKSGKLVSEEVANNQNDTEITTIISRMALPTGYEGTVKKCPSNLNNYASLPLRLIPPAYTTSKPIRASTLGSHN
jgi:hypothetical protein